MHVLQLYVFIFLIRCCDVRYNIRLKRYSVCLPSLVLKEIHVLFMLFCIYLLILVSNKIFISMMFVHCNSNPIGVTIGAVTATLPEHLGSPFLWVRVAQYFVFCEEFSKSFPYIMWLNNSVGGKVFSNWATNSFCV